MQHSGRHLIQSIPSVIHEHSWIPNNKGDQYDTQKVHRQDVEFFSLTEVRRWQEVVFPYDETQPQQEYCRYSRDKEIK